VFVLDAPPCSNLYVTFFLLHVPDADAVTVADSHVFLGADLFFLEFHFFCSATKVFAG